MTQGETAAVVVGGVGLTVLIVWLVSRHQSTTSTPLKPASIGYKDSIAAAITSAGGAAVAALGKRAGSAASDWLADL